jgi:hypothetical protein
VTCVTTVNSLFHALSVYRNRPTSGFRFFAMLNLIKEVMKRRKQVSGYRDEGRFALEFPLTVLPVVFGLILQYFITSSRPEDFYGNIESNGRSADAAHKGILKSSGITVENWHGSYLSLGVLSSMSAFMYKDLFIFQTLILSVAKFVCLNVRLAQFSAIRSR